MDFSNLPEGTIVYCCNICDSCWLDPDSVTLHIKSDHAFASEEQALQSISVVTVEKNESCETNNMVATRVATPEPKLWNKEATLLLINLVEEFEEKFENSVKKHIWLKISNIINEKLKMKLSWLQCDTKWKSLNKIYKDIKCHNNTSGKERKKWEYFEKMDCILFRKPEITPPATCSSSQGLKINVTKSNKETSNQNLLISHPYTSAFSQPSTSGCSQPSTSGCSRQIESTMAQKRKQHASETERRHKEKMAKQDEFLTQFKELIAILKSNKEKPENANVDQIL